MLKLSKSNTTMSIRIIVTLKYVKERTTEEMSSETNYSTHYLVLNSSTSIQKFNLFIEEDNGQIFTHNRIVFIEPYLISRNSILIDLFKLEDYEILHHPCVSSNPCGSSNPVKFYKYVTQIEIVNDTRDEILALVNQQQDIAIENDRIKDDELSEKRKQLQAVQRINRIMECRQKYGHDFSNWERKLKQLRSDLKKFKIQHAHDKRLKPDLFQLKKQLNYEISLLSEVLGF